jgi:phosphonate transport system substrate-binding protein
MNQVLIKSRLLLLALLVQLPGPVFSAETNQPPAPLVFRVGLASVCFRNVNRNDAVASYRLFLEWNGRRLGKTYRAEVEVFDETKPFEAAVQKEPMHMAVLGAWQFLNMDIHKEMKPYFAVMANGKVGRRYLILTRRDSGLCALRSLRGKAILQLDMATVNTGKAWLDTQLMSEGLGSQTAFFGGTETVSKATAAILPVFFGKQSACFVDEPSFDLMKELNPQVGQALQVVAASDPLADVVICLRNDGWQSEKDKLDTIQAMLELHKQPSGQQVCTLFKIDRIVPFQESQLETLRKLGTTYEALRTKGAP